MHPPTYLPTAVWTDVVRHAPLVSIDLVVRDPEGRILLGLRVNEPARGTWFVPGGAIRKRERLDDAFRRIATGELGVTLERGDAVALPVTEHHYDTTFFGEPGVGTHYVVLPYSLTLREPLAEPDRQHSSWRWAPEAELLADPLVHDNVKAYFA